MDPRHIASMREDFSGEIAGSWSKDIWAAFLGSSSVTVTGGLLVASAACPFGGNGGSTTTTLPNKPWARSKKAEMKFDFKVNLIGGNFGGYIGFTNANGDNNFVGVWLGGSTYGTVIRALSVVGGTVEHEETIRTLTNNWHTGGVRLLGSSGDAEVWVNDEDVVTIDASDLPASPYSMGCYLWTAEGSARTLSMDDLHMWQENY